MAHTAFPKVLPKKVMQPKLSAYAHVNDNSLCGAAFTVNGDAHILHACK